MSGTPGKLTQRQQLTIEETVERVKRGSKVIEAHVQAIKNNYDTDYPQAISSQNFSKLNYREELIKRLYEKGILGKDGKVQRTLEAGLEATKEGKLGSIEDMPTRLAYIQEIHKITGAYAPTRHESKNVTLHLNADEAEQRLHELEEEAEDADIIG